MQDLLGMAIFARVVSSGSFTAAAQQTGLSPSAISKHVSQLEDRLKVRLLNRSTRHIGVTEAGAVFYQHCERLLAEAEAAELAVSRLQSAPRGTLRLVAPIALGVLRIAPALPEFLRTYIELQLELVLNDQPGIMLANGFDIALQIGEPSDSSLQARRLTRYRQILCATPRYLEQYGVPATPAELVRHHCLTTHHTHEWQFHGADANAPAIAVSGRLRNNNSLAVHAAVLGDLGIGLLPDYVIDNDLRSGRLQALLPDYHAADMPVYALYPQSRHMIPKVRVLIDFLLTVFRSGYSRASVRT
jgi:DNA-binding transcriptional LysR family regulator